MATETSTRSTTSATTGSEWWRTAVIYQIYPRSFADASGDGIGDLPGITGRLSSLAELGVDAIWLSPFYTSPQNDAGYDVADYCDVDPLFGTLDDFDRMLETAHSHGIRVIVDLVPNHSSDQHRWFQAALAAGPGSEERDRYTFRDGRGENGELPPNNWQSVFGGSAWSRVTEADGEPGQWYLHLFDSSQPDFNWDNRWVHEQFLDVLRFWLDRGVDGFRVDVAHGLIKVEGLPDWAPPVEGGSMGGGSASLEPEISAEPEGAATLPPYWAQEGVHEIYREWRELLDSYDGDRALCAEAWVDPLPKLAKWVRPDEMHQAFNFVYLETPWKASALRTVIDDSLDAFGEVGAPSTWVLSNHDVVRHASRLALTADNLQGHGIGPKTKGLPDPVVGLRRARAATALMLALPGSAYLYQGEELGLPEVIDLPDEARQDPTFLRTNGERYGRDGCRVPIPWEAEAPACGFSETGESWLPQPAGWGAFARSEQRGVDGSTLELYRQMLALRAEHGLGLSTLKWLQTESDDVLAFTTAGITVMANIGTTDAALPSGASIILASAPLDGDVLPPDTTVWLR
ncbi:glycoside hydrolase family 13 protein [Salinibacterium sp. SYSU T00001]|uniref:glycoside hydrolase family 13 protein n=1 Tax=Homoserinimonas sedimenticola TaxID=2986805 RepID=UPI0022362FC9|nr:glycoside hydrolase family 13 protein [Salinibacterium sedimenticola]MCW4385984.1 glycoside hydrolase family 13 protein [Salinibacterium sedimenticola]